jgi:cyclopropane fatty-acyl-phospholipid synthase-like methyltransferase
VVVGPVVYTCAVRATQDTALREELLTLAHAKLEFNAPLSEERVDGLLRLLALAPGRHVLDLGCGWGELLLRIVAAHPASTGTGVDTDRRALDRARRAAAARSLYERVEFVEADLTTFDDRGDLVLCVGAAHAWGGAAAALRDLHERVEHGGTLLFADGFWERPPGEDARRLFGELPVFDALLQVAQAARFTIDQAERSTQDEWDAFEESWRAGMEAAEDPAVRLAAVERERDYRNGYRGVLGFAWLVLAKR